jgi:hypothetical protein
MRRFTGLSKLFSLLLTVGLLPARQMSPGEVQVVSKFVGTTIDIPEQQYYRIFDKVPDFINAQFQGTGNGFKAIIRTRRGGLVRRYSAREFYDLGLAIDLAGPIDSLVLVELSGKPAFEETVAAMQELPLGVKMVIYREKDRRVRGRYQGFEGQHFHLQARRGRLRLEPLDGMTRLRYRDLPRPELLKDVRVAAATTIAGMLAAVGLNWKLRIRDFDSRGNNVFWGGLAGLAAAKFTMHWGRVRRAEVHRVTISPEVREKIATYTILTFN